MQSSLFLLIDTVVEVIFFRTVIVGQNLRCLRSHTEINRVLAEHLALLSGLVRRSRAALRTRLHLLSSREVINRFWSLSYDTGFDGPPAFIKSPGGRYARRSRSRRYRLRRQWVISLAARLSQKE